MLSRICCGAAEEGERAPAPSGAGESGRAAPSQHCPPPPPPRRVTFRRVVAPLRGRGQSPVLPFACCVGSLRSVGRCGRCSRWCRFRVRGAQSLVCRGCAGCGGGRLTVFAAHAPPLCGRPPPPPPPPPRALQMPGYCTWAQGAVSTKAQKENGRVGGLQDHRCRSLTRGTRGCQWTGH